MRIFKRKCDSDDGNVDVATIIGNYGFKLSSAQMWTADELAGLAESVEDEAFA